MTTTSKEIWEEVLETNFVVRATKNRVRNEIVGKTVTIEDAREITNGYDDAVIYENLSGKVVE